MAYVALAESHPGAWALPAGLACACALSLALHRASARPDLRALQALFWVPVFALVLTIPVHTAVADLAWALDPNRFMCAGAPGEEPVRCGAIGIEVLIVPLSMLVLGVVYRLRWRVPAWEAAATAGVLAAALAWLGWSLASA